MDTQQTQGGTNPAFPSGESNGAGSLPVVAGVVAVLILLAGGWYWFTNMAPSNAGTPPMPEAMTQPVESAQADTATAALATQGTSDEVADIDADLKATDLNTLDPSGI